MIIVKIKAIGAKLEAEQPTVTSGSCNSVRVEFSFDDEWSGLYKTAVFKTVKGNILAVIENGACEFPAEALRTSGDVKLGVFGTDGSRTLTSLFCKVRVSHGVPTSGEKAVNYVPGIYEQLYSKIARFENITAIAEKSEDASARIYDDGERITLKLYLPKGEKGDRGDSGINGKDGYTPVRGTDYWTEADKQEMIEYIDEKLGSIDDALAELHTYAESLVGGDVE